ncbi:hypothetical protein ACSQ67_000551 [Phaseolus vulgaris]
MADARVGFRDNKRVEAESARVRVEAENARACEETKNARVCVEVESVRVLHKATRVFVWRQRDESVPVEAKGRECSCGGERTRVKSVRVSKMFSSSQFDAATAFSGGGFMSSQPSNLNDSSPAPSKSRETQGLVPVTVKQISEASQTGDEKSNFVINGVDLNNVTLVGMVFEKVERNTDVNFVLDDGTGRIKCRRWVNETFDTKEMEEVMNGMYVRVFGHLKSFQGVRQLVAFSVRHVCYSHFVLYWCLLLKNGVAVIVVCQIYKDVDGSGEALCIFLGALALAPRMRPVTNFDEIPFHFIDSIYYHLRSKMKLEGITSTNPLYVSSFNTPVKNAPNGSQAPPSNPAYAQYSVDGLKDCDKLIIDYLKQHSDISDEFGKHVNELSRELKLPMDRIMLSLKTLVDDGLVYSTIDDYHYKLV